MILVKLHCRRCNRAVAQIEHPPAEWEGAFRFQSCKCSRPSQERAQSVYAGRSWTEWEFVREIQWEALRGPIEAAQATGRTGRVTIVLT